MVGDGLLTILGEKRMNFIQKPLVIDKETHGFYPWTYVTHKEFLSDKR